MDQVFDTVRQAGKISGCAGNLDATGEYLNKGVRYLYTHFTSLLSAASAEFLHGVKNR